MSAGVAVDRRDASETIYGRASVLTNGAGSGVDVPHEVERLGGPLPATYPYIDYETFELARTARWWLRIQKLRIGMTLAEQDPALVDAMQSVENRYKRRVDRAMQAHPLYEWLEPLTGLRGASVAYIIGAIRDPHRFPGQKCEAGHHARVRGEEGEPCPIDGHNESDVSSERCGAPLLAPRRGTGVRALWHYCGLSCDDKGRAIRKRKGQQSSFDPQIKGMLLSDTGTAGQIVMCRTAGYRGVYDAKKEQLIEERVVEADQKGERDLISGPGGPLRLYQADAIARKVAVKAFMGDMLMEWKRRCPVEDPREIEIHSSRAPSP